jgi:hypothetical protein
MNKPLKPVFGKRPHLDGRGRARIFYDLGEAVLPSDGYGKWPWQVPPRRSVLDTLVEQEKEGFPSELAKELAKELADPKWLAKSFKQHFKKKRKRAGLEPANQALDALFCKDGIRDIPDHMTVDQLHERVNKWLVDNGHNKNISRETVRRAAGRRKK